MRHSIFMYLSAVMIFSGCATAGDKKINYRDKETREALAEMTEAITGKEVSEKDLMRLRKQMEEDEDARSAVESLTNSLGGAATPVRYCPVTGKRYSSRVDVCPIHHVPLKELDAR